MARDKDHDSVATITPLSRSHEADKKHKKKKKKHDEDRESSKHSKVKKENHHHHHRESQSSRHSDGSLNHKSKKDRHEDGRREGSSSSHSKEHKKRKREKSRESDGREGYGSKTESLHKKERKDYVVTKVEMENNNEEEPLDDPSLLPNEWTYDDEVKLVETMKEQVPINDIKSHRLTLKKIDWGTVSMNFTHSAAECEEKWKEIMGFLVLLKPLSMLLMEAEVELKNLKRRRQRIAKPYGRFLKEFCAKNSCKGQGNVLNKATEAWKRLDPKIKQQYYNRYYQELQEAGVGDTQLKHSEGPTPVLGPFEIFLKRFDADDSRSKKDRRNSARLVWTSLSVAEKVGYLEEYFEDYRRYQKEVEEHKAEHPEWNAPKHRGPNKEDIKLYLEYHGIPTVPQSSPAMLMLNDMDDGAIDGQESDGKKRLIIAHQKFKEMKEGEREKYKDKLELLWKDYKRKLEQWKQNADKNMLDIADKYLKDKKEPKILRAKRVKPNNSPRKKEVEQSVESSLLTVKFLGEPPKPPASGYRLFFTRFMKQSSLPVNERMRQAGSYWEKLTEEQKDCYERKAKELKESFCNDVMVYVEGLSEEYKKMYIGTKRRYFKKLFGHDPFADDYPTSEYPVFVRSPKQKTPQSKVQNKPAEVKKKEKVVKKEDSDDSDDSSDESKGRQDDEEGDDEESSDEESEESEDNKEQETSKSRNQVMARASGLSQLIKHTNNQNSSDSSDSDSSSDESSGSEENDNDKDDDGDEEQEGAGDEEEDDDDDDDGDDDDDDDDEEEKDQKERPPTPPPAKKTPTVPKDSGTSHSREKTHTNSISKSTSPSKVMNSSEKPSESANKSSSESDDSSEASSEEDSDESADDVAPAWHNQSATAVNKVQQSQEDSDSDSSDSD
ncbi:uncharacterized protein LOC143024841 isoform X2 [Oratosquilla oratoria]